MSWIRKRRSPLFVLIYLVVVAGLAVTLWFLIPDEVKQTVRDTYFNPDRAADMAPRHAGDGSN